MLANKRPDQLAAGNTSRNGRFGNFSGDERPIGPSRERRYLGNNVTGLANANKTGQHEAVAKFTRPCSKNRA